MSDEVVIVAQLDEELPVVKGATFPEILLAAKYAALLNGMLGALFGLVYIKAWFLIAFPFFLLGTFCTVWLVAANLKRLKRGKPPGYIMQKVDIFATKYLGKKPGFILKTGYWHGNRQ